MSSNNFNHNFPVPSYSYLDSHALDFTSHVYHRNAPSSFNNTLTIPSLSPVPSSSTDSFFLGHPMPQINDTQSARVSSGFEHKTDMDEDLSGPSRLPITQQLSQAQSVIPKVMPQLSPTHANIAAGVPQNISLTGLEAININLNGLISHALPVQLPGNLDYLIPLLTTRIVRERRFDEYTLHTSRLVVEARLYPYLWFPGHAPYQLDLEKEDRARIVHTSLIAKMQERMLDSFGCLYGRLALTASGQCVLYFQREEELIFDFLVKFMNTNSDTDSPQNGSTATY